MTHDAGATPLGVIALGASAGGIDALQRAVAGLPPDSPFAFCVVLHLAATPRSVLADIIARRTRLSVRAAAHGDELRPGHVYVAPPDRHLLVADGRIVLDAGPKENSARPAIDVLFRSVAQSYGPRGGGRGAVGRARRRRGRRRRGRRGRRRGARAGSRARRRSPACPWPRCARCPGARVTTAAESRRGARRLRGRAVARRAPGGGASSMSPDPPPPSRLSRTPARRAADRLHLP